MKDGKDKTKRTKTTTSTDDEAGVASQRMNHRMVPFAVLFHRREFMPEELLFPDCNDTLQQRTEQLNSVLMQAMIEKNYTLCHWQWYLRLIR
jgi:hypothetical protein